MNRRLIGIVGPTASGKSTVASIIDGDVLSMDDFYKDYSDVHEPHSVNFDHPRTLDWMHFEKALVQLQAGVGVGIPEYDFETAGRDGVAYFDPGETVLVEGIWAAKQWITHDPTDFYDTSIYIDVPADIRLVRRIERDTAERGRTWDEVIEDWEENVRPMEKEHVLPTAPRCDYVVDGHRDVADVAAEVQELVHGD